jgi:integrase
MECLRLHVQDIDFFRREILVHNGKGAKDRIRMLPESLKAPLHDHLERVKAIPNRDLADGCGCVVMPEEWRWQWVFPQESRWKNIKTGEQGRHHTHETILQRAVREAVQKAGVVKHVGCHTFRHSFAPIC